MTTQENSAGLAFSSRVRVPSNVMFRELEGESVILDLDSESYFGLDEVGTRMWLVLTESSSIEAAHEALLDEFEVEAERLRGDLSELVDRLVDRGLFMVDVG